jgi:hypothetical protein
MSIATRRPSGEESEEIESATGAKPTKEKSIRGTKAKAGTAAVKPNRQTKLAKPVLPAKQGWKRPSGHVSELVTVGSEPRVDLLPPEVRAERKARSTRRSLGYAVLATLIVVVLAIGAAFAFNVAAQARMLVAQAQTATLLTQQQKFIDMRVVQAQVEVAQAAQQVGASTEIDWKDYLTRVQGTLPSNVAIDKLTVDSSTPLAIYTQSTAPLQGARVATVTFTASSATIPQVPTWLRSLATLPGYADVTPGTIDLDTTTGLYKVNITMHVTDAAFDKRFQPKGK